jgi:hypothetical protein
VVKNSLRAPSKVFFFNFTLVYLNIASVLALSSLILVLAAFFNNLYISLASLVRVSRIS